MNSSRVSIGVVLIGLICGAMARCLVPRLDAVVQPFVAPSGELKSSRSKLATRMTIEARAAQNSSVQSPLEERAKEPDLRAPEPPRSDRAELLRNATDEALRPLVDLYLKYEAEESLLRAVGNLPSRPLSVSAVEYDAWRQRVDPGTWPSESIRDLQFRLSDVNSKSANPFREMDVNALAYPAQGRIEVLFHDVPNISFPLVNPFPEFMKRGVAPPGGGGGLVRECTEAQYQRVWDVLVATAREEEQLLREAYSEVRVAADRGWATMISAEELAAFVREASGVLLVRRGEDAELDAAIAQRDAEEARYRRDAESALTR